MKAAISILIVLCLAWSSFAEDRKDPMAVPRTKCPVCGMLVSMFADWNAKITFPDSTSAVFEGSKDMFKYILNMTKYDPSKSRGSITSIIVKDYSSKEDIDALKAFYVIWSDVYGPMGHEPIPFEKETDAKLFLKEHQGKKILRFQNITLKLLNSLDNPE